MEIHSYTTDNLVVLQYAFERPVLRDCKILRASLYVKLLICQSFGYTILHDVIVKDQKVSVLEFYSARNRLPRSRDPAKWTRRTTLEDSEVNWKLRYYSDSYIRYMPGYPSIVHLLEKAWIIVNHITFRSPFFETLRTACFTSAF